MRARDAVGAGVTAADDDHVPARGGDRRLGRARDCAVASIEVLHREVDPVELAPRNRQVARYTRTGAQHGRVERGEIVRMHVGPESELDSFFGELLDAPLDDVLLDLEVGHPEAQEAAACLVALEDRDGVACAVQLLPARETRRARADDGDGAARALARRLGDDPALVPCARDDRELDLLDRHRVGIDAEDAGVLARRRAETAGELREVVRTMQLRDRFAPAVAIDEVVPIRDEVPERAAVMTERHAALHAASTLLAELDERKHAHELEVVAHPLARRAVRCLPAVELLEAADLAHIYLLAPFRGASARSHRFASLCFPARAPATADRLWAAPAHVGRGDGIAPGPDPERGLTHLVAMRVMPLPPIPA